MNNLNWYDNIYYQNQKVSFNHKKDYTKWIQRRKFIINLIKNNKII